ncbi:MAG TPA: hypothetical protein DCQ37_02650 [Desulfobacteraceae bacterium]|nr:hypothetical protein [Desulfobacteraceae bacterium]
MYEDVESRFESMEYYMRELAYQQMKTEMAVQSLSKEMKDFKNEMGDFKNEMGDFKDEMSGFKNEVKQEHKRMNKQWGELANKMGTLVEDIIAPAVRPVFEKYFNCQISDFSVNRRKKIGALKGEFDIIAISDRYAFVVEVKSRPKKEYLYEFIKNLEKFKKLFPEYIDKHIIPVFGSLRFDDDLIKLAVQEKIYLLAYREWEYMDILNFEQIHN